MWVPKQFRDKHIYLDQMKKNRVDVKMLNFKKICLISSPIIAFSFYISPSFSKGKIYGQSKTLSKEYTKYENCRLRKTEINIKDGVKDGYKCIFKRQSKGKDVTVFQPSPVCQKSFKCKSETQ